MKDDYWKHIMRRGVRRCIDDERISISEGISLIQSVGSPYKEVEPFDPFTEYLFKKANEKG